MSAAVSQGSRPEPLDDGARWRCVLGLLSVVVGLAPAAVRAAPRAYRGPTAVPSASEAAEAGSMEDSGPVGDEPSRAPPDSREAGDSRSETEPPVRPEYAGRTRDTPPLGTSGAQAFASIEEGFGVRSREDRFGLRLGALAQFRYLGEVNGSARHGFRFRALRTSVLAHAFGDRVELLIVPEFSGSPQLLDAVATVRISPAFQLQIGQYRTWYTRNLQIILPMLALPDRGPLNEEFSVGRDRGVTILGRLWQGKFEYAAGVLNGEGIDGFNLNPHMLYTARVVVNPLGPLAYTATRALAEERPLRVSFGLNAYTNEVDQFEPDPADPEELIQIPDLRTWGAGGDFALAWERLHVLGEGFWRLSRVQGRSDVHDWGAALEAAIMIVDRRFELSYRNSILDVANEMTLPVEPGINVYIWGNLAKIQIRYRCDIDPSSAECLLHQGMVQGQLFF